MLRSVRLVRVFRILRVARVLSGFREFRVRFEQDTARLEIALDELPRCLDPERRDAIMTGVKAAGFQRVVLDLAGFRSGSLNDSRP